MLNGLMLCLIAMPSTDRPKMVITHDPAAMSNTTITYTSVENELLVNVGGASVLKLEDSYSEAQVSPRVSIVAQNSTLVSTESLHSTLMQANPNVRRRPLHRGLHFFY